MGIVSVDTGRAKPISQAAYARRIGVDPSTVTRWIQNERISRLPNGLIDPEQADREREATESPMPHHQARKAQIDAEREAKAAAPPAAPDPTSGLPGAGMPPLERLGAALKLETYKLQKAKAETANLELDKAAGLLVERAEVDAVLADFGITLRGLLERVPHRGTPALLACRGDADAVHRALGELMAETLDELTAHMRRKLEAL